MTMTQAAISEPLAIGVYAVKRSIPMKGAKVGILGAGPIGFSVMLPAIAQGAEKIYVTDKIDARLDIAKKHGATWVGNPDSTDIVRQINDLEDGQYTFTINQFNPPQLPVTELITFELGEYLGTSSSGIPIYDTVKFESNFISDSRGILDTDLSDLLLGD